MENDQKRPDSIKYGRLVILFVLLGLFFSCNDIPEDALRSLKPDDFQIRSKAEILAVMNVYLHEQPVYYLLFLPGPLLLTAVMLLRKYKIIRFPGLLLFLSVLFFAAAQENAGKYLENSIKAYGERNYKLALTGFLEAEKQLPSNPFLKYNIALCYYKLENPGTAIFFLKKAILLDAGDAQAGRFLRLLEIVYDLNSQVNTNPYYHPNIPFILILIFYNLSFVLFLLLRKYRKGQVVIIFIFSILLTLGAAGVFIYGLVHMHQPIGVIVNAPAGLTQIPESTGKERIKLKEGTIVRVLWKMQPYVFIRTNMGLQGWVKRESILLN